MEGFRKGVKECEGVYQPHKKTILNDENLRKNYSSFAESGMSQERVIKSRGVCLPAAIADGLARHRAHEQSVYKQKLKKLKTLIKNIVLENAALCDVVSSVQDELALAIEERQHLLRRVMHIQLSTDQPVLQQELKALPSIDDDFEKYSQKKSYEEKSGTLHQRQKVSLVKRKASSLSCGDKTSIGGIRPKSRLKKGSKVKRKCPAVPLDSAGRPLFPLVLGRLTIYSLGEIVSDKEGYHTERMIFPVGFCSSRMYASLKNPHQQTLYTCTIKEGGASPRFDIVCDEDESAFYGTSPSECHSQILNKINLILGIDLLPTSVDTVEAEERGLRFFGLSHPSVQNMIQACPGARKCAKYKWIQFEVCKSELEAEGGVLGPDREASICHETLLRNIRFASNHM